MEVSKANKLLKLVREQGMIRSRDLQSHGIPREYPWRLYSQGVLERASRGIYYLPDLAIGESHSLAETAKLVPKGVICLLSALRFHEMTTLSPFEVWIAVDPKAYRPSITGLALRVVRFSGHALTSGVEEHTIEGVSVKVYSPAKTVADCFKYRNKIGLDVALEALREYQQKHRRGIDELWKYAKICRVSNIIRPYLEALA